MHTDATEQLNRYLASNIKATGGVYKPGDSRIDVILENAKDASMIQAIAKFRIDELKKQLDGQKAIVTNWFNLSDIGGKLMLSLTYRVM